MLRTVTLLAVVAVVVASASDGPVRESSAPAIIDELMPGFYNGYLFSIAPPHVVTLFAPDGHEVGSYPIIGQENVRIKSIAVDADGTIAVAWADGTRGAIDLRDSYGNVRGTIDTRRFVAAHIAFGADHSLWALGWQRDAAKPNQSDAGDYAIVRRFSLDGTALGTFLPRSLFAPGLPPGMDEWQHQRITVTVDRVGVEVVSGKVGSQREWVELDLNGNILGRFKLDPAQHFHHGVAFTADDQAYVHRYDEQVKAERVYRLNHASCEWEPVNSPNGMMLYGADGTNLVFANWPDRIMHLAWYTPSEVQGPTIKCSQ